MTGIWQCVQTMANSYTLKLFCNVVTTMHNADDIHHFFFSVQNFMCWNSASCDWQTGFPLVFALVAVLGFVVNMGCICLFGIGEFSFTILQFWSLLQIFSHERCNHYVDHLHCCVVSLLIMSLEWFWVQWWDLVGGLLQFACNSVCGWIRVIRMHTRFVAFLYHNLPMPGHLYVSYLLTNVIDGE